MGAQFIVVERRAVMDSIADVMDGWGAAMREEKAMRSSTCMDLIKQ